MQKTPNYNLNKPEQTDVVNIEDLNANFDTLDTELKKVAEGTNLFKRAGGTGTAIIVSDFDLEDGIHKTFIITTNNNGSGTTINGKPLYKPNTTQPPTLIAGKAVTVWYDDVKKCFFIKASAEGNAVAGDVLAGKTFSNDEDTGLIGTIIDRGAVVITPGTTSKPISSGYHNGLGYVAGDSNLVPSKILLNETVFGVVGSGVGVRDCNQISGLSGLFASSIQGRVVLNWTNPTDGLFKGVRIVYKTGSYPTSPSDGSVAYDSNGSDSVANTVTLTLIEGTTYYFRAFAYTYRNATRLYNTLITGAQVSGIPYRVQGSQVFTSSGVFTIPANVNSIDVFCVGGGGKGGTGNTFSSGQTSGGNGGGGAGGGYTTTLKKISVIPGQQYAVTIGAGATTLGDHNNASTGGASSFGSLLVANGGNSAWYNGASAGSGGSGGGYGSSYSNSPGSYGGANHSNGGTDGSNGLSYTTYSNGSSTGTSTSGVGNGQGSTTKAFAESSGTMYSSGGNGKASGTSGAANTGNGGNGGNDSTYSLGGNGGSGIVIVRWGY